MKVTISYLGMSRDLEFPMDRLVREMRRQGKSPDMVGYHQKEGHLWDVWGPELTIVIDDPLANWVHVPDYTPKGVVQLYEPPSRRAWLEIWHEGQPLANLPVEEVWNEAGERVFPIEAVDPGCWENNTEPPLEPAR